MFMLLGSYNINRADANLVCNSPVIAQILTIAIYTRIRLSIFSVA